METLLSEPGAYFHEFVETAAQMGYFPDAGDDLASFVEWRLLQHETVREPFTLQRQGGLWLRVNETEAPDGSVITVATDITHEKKLTRLVEKITSVLASEDLVA